MKLLIRNIICLTVAFIILSCKEKKATTTFILVTPSEGVTLLVQDVPCIDIRSLDKRNYGFINSSLSIPEANFYNDSIVTRLDKQKSILVYNEDGTDYEKIKLVLEEKQFVKVYLLLGGFKSWKHQGLDITNN